MIPSSRADNRREPARGNAFADLRRFLKRPAVIQRCEMCSAAVAPEHRHVLDTAANKILCACGPCALLFGSQGEGKYKLIPRETRTLPGFQLTDAQWDALRMPINLAFFVNSTAHGLTIAIYPSPAGPTESLLELDHWSEIVRDNAILNKLAPDVEALLVNRLGAARDFAEHEYYIAPIDVCYSLVGIIRGRWRGLSGGTEVWQEMTRFFADLKRRAVHA